MARQNLKVKLANPLPAKYALQLGLENKEYPLGEVVELHPDRARDLEGAGYVAAYIEGKTERKVPDIEDQRVAAQRSAVETEKKKS